MVLTINKTQNQSAIFFNLSLDDLTIRCFGYYKLISESIEYPTTNIITWVRPSERQAHTTLR